MFINAELWGASQGQEFSHSDLLCWQREVSSAFQEPTSTTACCPWINSATTRGALDLGEARTQTEPVNLDLHRRRCRAGSAAALVDEVHQSHAGVAHFSYRASQARWPAAVVLIALVCVLSPAPARADMCDPALKQITDTPLGYRQRGDRCEGLYVREVTSSVLRVVGLTESFETYDPAAARSLFMEWSRWTGINPSTPVRLRAEALRPRSYYRMDAQRSVDSTTFTWAGDVVSSQRFQRHELGLLAIGQGKVGQSDRTVYLPLRASQHGRVSRSDGYRLTLMPGVDLDEVFLSLGAAGADGRAQSWLKEGEPQALGFLPAARAFSVMLPLPGAAGVYHAQVGARIRGGGAVTVDLWFHHDGRRPN